MGTIAPRTKFSGATTALMAKIYIYGNYGNTRSGPSVTFLAKSTDKLLEENHVVSI